MFDAVIILGEGNRFPVALFVSLVNATRILIFATAESVDDCDSHVSVLHSVSKNSQSEHQTSVKTDKILKNLQDT